MINLKHDNNVLFSIFFHLIVYKHSPLFKPGINSYKKWTVIKSTIVVAYMCMQMRVFISNSAITVWTLIQQQLFRNIHLPPTSANFDLRHTIEKLVFDLFA